MCFKCIKIEHNIIDTQKLYCVLFLIYKDVENAYSRT